MKTGMTLHELACEIQRQQDAKEDYTGTTEHMHMTSQHEDGTIRFELQQVGDFGMTTHAHRQIGAHSGIPAKYYDRMREAAPDLLAHNVNHWLSAQPSRRLIRTLDGDMRAFLSDHYRPLDNADLAEAVLPALHQAGANVHSAHITETKLYIKAVVDGRSVTVPPPANASGPGYRREVVVQPGIVITNSEVGAGAITVQPAIHELACLNMATWAADALRKAHLGARIASENDDIAKYLTTETKQIVDQAVWAQVRNIADAAMSGKMFEDLVAKLTAARENTFQPHDTNGVIERVSNAKGLNENERDSVLGYLIQGGELSQYGIQAAITRASQDLDDYTRATELEVMGGDIITLPARDWDRLITS